MNTQWRFFAALLFTGFFSVSVLAAVDTGPIDRVRQAYSSGTGGLTSVDISIIDSFLDSAVNEMLSAKELWEAVDTRALILDRKGTGPASEYSREFVKSLHKHLEPAFKSIARTEDSAARVLMQRNLIVLVAHVQDAALADIAVALFKHDDPTVRYWAVKAVANAEVLGQVKSGLTADPAKLGEIIQSFSDLIESGSKPEILYLIARSAAFLDRDTGLKLLKNLARKRIDAYMSWNVDYEIMDGVLLKILAELAVPQNQSAPDTQALGDFAQLYSCLIQRYIKVSSITDDTRRQAIESVIVDVEQSAISSLFGAPRTGLKRAIEKRTIAAVQTEHDLLLGSPSQTGELPGKLKFNYGQDSDGGAAAYPAKLPAPPEKL